MLESSNQATASGELFRQLANTARHIEVQWSPSRAQGILRGVERQRRQQQRRRAMLPMLCAASLVVVLASVASWAAWSQRSSSWTWPWSSQHSTIIPQVPTERATLRARRGVSTQVMEDPAVLSPAVDEQPDQSEDRPENLVTEDREAQDAQQAQTEERHDPIAQLPAVRGPVKLGRAKPTLDRPRALPAPSPPAPAIAEAGPEDKPTWQQLAHDGQFEKAYTVAYEAGEAAPAPSMGAGDMLLLADVARLSHHPADAVTPLTKLLGNHATDPRAPLAAFTLGRVLLDDLGRPREAADAFRRVQTLESQGIDGPLAQDALAREVEAWSRAGEPQRARDRAQEYVRHYPTGRRLRSVRHYGELD